MDMSITNAKLCFSEDFIEDLEIVSGYVEKTFLPDRYSAAESRLLSHDA